MTTEKLSSKTAARMLSVSDRTLAQWIADGLIKPRWLGEPVGPDLSRRTASFWARQDLERFAKKRGTTLVEVS